MLFTRKAADALAPQDAAEARARGHLTIVDVRDSDERVEARVPGSLHIPLGALARRVAELPADQPVAFICRSGRRSAMAVRAAGKHGIASSNVRGGLLAWERSGLAVERGPEAAGGHGEPRT